MCFYIALLVMQIGSSILAQAAGVPTLPWSGTGVSVSFADCCGVIPPDTYQQACVDTVEAAMECCQRIGYPVMLKASWGGGGKGIRKVLSDDDVKVVFKQIQVRCCRSVRASASTITHSFFQAKDGPGSLGIRRQAGSWLLGRTARCNTRRCKAQVQFISYAIHATVAYNVQSAGCLPTVSSLCLLNGWPKRMTYMHFSTFS